MIQGEKEDTFRPIAIAAPAGLPGSGGSGIYSGVVYGVGGPGQ